NRHRARSPKRCSLVCFHLPRRQGRQDGEPLEPGGCFCPGPGLRREQGAPAREGGRRRLERAPQLLADAVRVEGDGCHDCRRLGLYVASAGSNEDLVIELLDGWT